MKMPMLSSDGVTLTTNKNEILERWAEHFNCVLNRLASINGQAIQGLPQVDVNPNLDIPISEYEVAKGVKRMSTGKAPDEDANPAEVLKSVGPSLLRKLTEMYQSFWESETLPREFKGATIMHIYKRNWATSGHAIIRERSFLSQSQERS